MPLIRYPLDATGLNPDNRVVGEIKTLANTQVKAVVPTYGPIYSDGLVVVDNLTNITLVKGVDYTCVQLLQEATLRFGKEIFEVILIKKPDVSSTVRINYQVLGGLFQNNAAGIENLYQAAVNNNTPISWENVLNKPYEYTPTLHNHMLQDVVGFEPLVVALERVRNAVTLTDVPAFEALIAWVNDILALVGTDKANSTHTHPVSDIVGLQTIINNLQNGKANLTDFNTLSAFVTTLDLTKASIASLNTLIGEVAALENAIDAQLLTINQVLGTKSAIGHDHSVSDVSGLQSALDNKADLSHTHSNYAIIGHGHNTSDISGLDAAIADLIAQSNSGSGTDYNAGSIVYFARNTAPNGYVLADGRFLSRLDYPDLFAAIGTTFGGNDGINNGFNVPDLRGWFIRSWDNGGGVDTGRGFGTYQQDEFGSHTHAPPIGLNAPYLSNPFSGDGAIDSSEVTGPTEMTMVGGNTQPAGGTETRPKNIALLACIKATNSRNGGTSGSGSGTVTSVGITGSVGRIIASGGPITSSGGISLDLATTGVAAGSYTNVNVTVDEYGRVTAVSNGSASSSDSGISNLIALTSSQVWTIPPGVTTIKATLVGGSGLQAGGNGASVIKYYRNLTPGNTLSVTVGGWGGNSSISSGTENVLTAGAGAGGTGQWSVTFNSISTMWNATQISAAPGNGYGSFDIQRAYAYGYGGGGGYGIDNSEGGSGTMTFIPGDSGVVIIEY